MRHSDQSPERSSDKSDPNLPAVATRDYEASFAPPPPLRKKRSLWPIWMTLLITLPVSALLFAMLTTWPIQGLVASLQKHGFAVEGVSGNLSQGFNVVHLGGEIGTTKFSASDLSFTALGLIDLALYDRVVLESFSIKKLNIEFENPMGAGAAGQPSDQLPTGRSSNRSNYQDSSLPLRVFYSPMLNIETMQVSLAGSKLPAFRFQNVKTGKILVNESKVEIDRASLPSREAEFQFSQLLLLPRDQSASLTGSGILRRSYHPELLRDIPFQVDVTVLGGRIDRLHFDAVDSQLQVDQTSDGHLVVKTKNLNPSQILRMALPLTRLDLELDFESREVLVSGLPRARGSFAFRGKTFAVVENEQPLQIPRHWLMPLGFLPQGSRPYTSPRLFVPQGPGLSAIHQQGHKAYRITYQSTRLSDLIERRDLFHLASTISQTRPDDIIADMYYSRPRMFLKAEESKLILEDLGFLESGRFLISQASQPTAATSPGARTPASLSPQPLAPSSPGSVQNLRPVRSTPKRPNTLPPKK